MTMRVRGVWGDAHEAGFTRSSVGAYLDGLAETGFNALFMNVKQGDGQLCWPSERFPQAVREEYRNFDFPQILIEEGRKRGIEVHAWMIDFMEGENGAAYREHPEWAMLNREGKPTSSETLRGRRFGAIWMCPAQRPGYTDQWLVPLYVELAERYDFASLHHDYIRYPGDLAPDQYCFCDHCLAELPRWAGYLHEVHSEEPFAHDLYDRPYLEAHWEQSPRVLPGHWESLPRAFRADFLREGSFFTGGRADLDYFFYRYRVEQITEFARLSAEGVRAARPGTKLSGAYFKNPIHSGRFIGQDWRAFAPWSDICIPMDYRDHFPGTMEHYLDLLAEAIGQQKRWAAGEQALWIGFALWPLFREESTAPYPADKVTRTIERIAATGVEGLVMFCSGDLERFGVKVAVRDAFGKLQGT